MFAVGVSIPNLSRTIDRSPARKWVPVGSSQLAIQPHSAPQQGYMPRSTLGGKAVVSSSQPSRVSQPGTAKFPIAANRPAPPPVYRPQASRVSQPSMAKFPGVASRPAPPPVYRPQASKVSQPSMAKFPGVASRPAPPPVYRPQASKVSQPSMAKFPGVASRPAPPPVYRPQAAPPRHAPLFAFSGTGAGAGVLQRKVLALRSNDLSGADLESGITPELVHRLQSAGTVVTGAERLSQKKQGGAVVDDKNGTLSDLGPDEKLYIIGHGLEELSNLDEIYQIKKIDKYGGYDSAELANLLLRMGIPEGYHGLIHLTGCYPAAGEGTEQASYLRRFQAELRKVGIPSGVKGGLGSTVIEESGNVWVEKHFGMENLPELMEKIKVEEAYDKLLDKISALARNKIPTEYVDSRLRELLEKLEAYEALDIKDITHKMVGEATRWKDEADALSREIAKSHRPAMRRQLDELGVHIRTTFFTRDKARKITLPGSPVSTDEIEHERVKLLRETQRPQPMVHAPIFETPNSNWTEEPKEREYPALNTDAMEALAQEAAVDAYSGHVFHQMRGRIHQLVEKDGNRKARVAFNRMLIRAFKNTADLKRETVVTYLSTHCRDENSHPVSLYESLSRFYTLS
jgi:hypothetical protein